MKKRGMGGKGGGSRGPRRKDGGRPGKRERKARGSTRISGKGSQVVRGELRLTREGYGFVVPREGEDIFIPARFVGDALHTDIVEARVTRGRGARQEGRISKVIERRVENLMGRLERQENIYQVIADDRRVKHRIVISPEALGGANHGDNVVVRVVKYPHGDRPMRGEVLAVLGRRGEEDTEREAVIVRHQLRREFPKRVVQEAESVRSLMEEGLAGGRKDLRDVQFVTIDGVNAEDFDDAVAVKRLDRDLIRLWVSIADVSFFVRTEGALDSEAYERGTSVYFPGFCIPMLPETISNDLCSLRPREDRLTFTAEMDVDADGRVARSRFYRSAIHSRARLTYAQVKGVLVDRDEALRGELAEQVDQLELMEECFRRLRETRLSRGSIDFDLPEPEIQLDMQGAVEDIVRADRHTGHMIIEEFMIAANEAVARFLTEKGPGCIYRIHEPPPEEKLREFAELIHNLGYGARLSGGAGPGKLARIVKWAHGKPFERLVNHSLLRSMSQAVYSPSNKGHYGLASKCYCHFTSPIRRYPDLMVHRLLSYALSQEHGTWDVGGGTKKALVEIAEKSSRCERTAMDAEREMAKLYAALFMKAHVGEEFGGIISHVAKFGIFVELRDFFVEGLIHVSALDDDRYIYDEEGMRFVGKSHRKAYRVGDEVRVEVFNVDVPNREIVFELV
jgi:ribonuclease R